MKQTVLLQSNITDSDKSLIRLSLQTQIRNVQSCRLILCALPNTVYNIENDDTDFIIQTSTGSIIPVNIPIGKWSLDELLLVIESNLNLHPLSEISRTWFMNYDPKTFKVKLSNDSILWRFTTLNKTILPILGYTQLSTDFSKTQTASQAPRMNSNKLVGIRIHELPGGVEIANLGVQYTFVIPFTSVCEQITFLGRDALRGQKVRYNQNGIDLKNLTVELMETENLSRLKVHSDWSILLEIESRDD